MSNFILQSTIFVIILLSLLCSGQHPGSISKYLSTAPGLLSVEVFPAPCETSPAIFKLYRKNMASGFHSLPSSVRQYDLSRAVCRNLYYKFHLVIRFFPFTPNLSIKTAVLRLCLCQTSSRNRLDQKAVLTIRTYTAHRINQPLAYRAG